MTSAQEMETADSLQSPPHLLSMKPREIAAFRNYFRVNRSYDKHGPAGPDLEAIRRSIFERSKSLCRTAIVNPLEANIWHVSSDSQEVAGKNSRIALTLVDD